ncbi:Na+/H+ antiporter subunit E [Pseudokineococcus lusitanus]|uniref:Multisubunit Na+/H+ antiporter MnhE subunit n=1 Tax=Pseudokineococcus lusitanus TaxID=763993 RepID=A0A3N1GAE5_9ACTN|nr:Na+/H+ antiporter subunit E [Pseudokineococcus lusitanus]ROP27148.1 multisubunit Na+/H+ antiporter MnhE subunit [Pseudokineococcus lusitanus]
MSRTRRAVVQWPVLVWTALVWVLLWGDLSVANVLSGVLLGLLVVLVFPQPPLRFPGAVRPVAALRLLLVFVRDVVVASVQVALVVLTRRAPTSSVLEVHLRTASLSHLTATAELISLVPGSVVVEVRPGTQSLFVHALDTPDLEAAERARRDVLAVEARVVRAFGTDEEVGDLERGDPSGHGRHPRPPVRRRVVHGGGRTARQGEPAHEVGAPASAVAPAEPTPAVTAPAEQPAAGRPRGRHAAPREDQP